MKKYLKGKKTVVELGSGNGCITKIIKNKKIILTDIVKYPWIEKKNRHEKGKFGKKLPKKSRYFYY